MFTLAVRVTTLKLAHYAVGWLPNESDTTALMRRLPHLVGLPPEDDITAHLMRRRYCTQALLQRSDGAASLAGCDISRPGNESAPLGRQNALDESRHQGENGSQQGTVSLGRWEQLQGCKQELPTRD